MSAEPWTDDRALAQRLGCPEDRLDLTITFAPAHGGWDRWELWVGRELAPHELRRMGFEPDAGAIYTAWWWYSDFPVTLPEAEARRRAWEEA